jgi:hypothetical protein
MTPAKLPRQLVINDTVHIRHYKDSKFVILQNYTQQVQSSQDPLRNPSPGIQGTSQFHLYRVTTGQAGEEQLGELLASYSTLDAAMARAGQEQ